MTRYFVDFDGANEPTVWLEGSPPTVVVRRAELPGPHADLLWRVLTGVLCADVSVTNQVALALEPGPARHSQFCPVWTHRQTATRRPCDCQWVRRAERVLAALRGEQ